MCDPDTGLYHYGLQIVPAMKKRNGNLETSNLNNYSVTERKVKVNFVFIIILVHDHVSTVKLQMCFVCLWVSLLLSLQLADLNRGLSLGGSAVQNFVGVVVTYEFYPVSRQ